MGKITRAGVLVLSICASAVLVRAQVQQSSSDSSAVIRATTRLVQVDVVVTDSSGHPAKDRLSEKDFTILEDGKPQKVPTFLFSSLKDRRGDRSHSLPNFRHMWPPTGQNTSAARGRRSSCCSMASTRQWKTRWWSASKC